MEAMDFLSDDGGDVNDDWHDESLSKEDGEGFLKIIPAKLLKSCIDW
jgi:hypothetical protein